MTRDLIPVRGILAIFGDVTGKSGSLGGAASLLEHRAWGGYASLLENGEMVRYGREEVGEIFSGIVGCLPHETSVPAKPSGMIHGSIYADGSPLFDLLARPDDMASIGNIARQLYEIDGSYCFVIISDKGIIAGRDRMGGKPLYLGNERGVIVALSTERKPLEQLRLDIEQFPPGSILTVQDRKATLWRTSWEEKSTDRFEDFEGHELLNHLEGSIEKRISRSGKIALSFSGGLDSSLLATIAMKLCRVVGITVGIKGSSDLIDARRYAEMIGLDLVEVELTIDELRREVQLIMRTAEVEDALDTSIASAFYFASRRANEEGCREIVLGQLADELFGGYARYLRTYCERGERDVEMMMAYDVINAARLNSERDEKSVSPHAEIQLPYASLEVVKYGLACPVEMKLDCKLGLRKAILRKAAKSAGLPDEIAMREKKAVQYSSGIYKALKTIL